MHKSNSVILFVGLLLTSLAAQSQLVGSFSGGDDLSVGPGTAGFTFTVGAQPLTVQALGVFDASGEGLSSSHQVGIWTTDASPILLGSATVSPGSASQLDSFWYQSTSPILLLAGTAYTIGASYVDVDQDLARGNTASLVLNGAAFLNANLSTGSGFEYPDIDVTGNSFFGPNASFTPIPEPNYPITFLAVTLACLTLIKRGTDKLRLHSKRIPLKGGSMNKLSRLFVRNDGAAPAAPAPAKTTKAIQTLTCNLLPKLVRHDQMEGRDFIVVPMVILTEGVHKGSEGPLYYPSEELSKTPVVWNHKPIVVYHPEINGQGVSACDPTILTTRKVGVMMNTKFEKGRLKSEAWLEKDRADAVDKRIMAAVENNEMMELSTGVFVDAELSEGKWKEEPYIGLARNYRPDHLAILPDRIGACSIADGAGFLRNEGDKKNPIVGLFNSFLVRMGLAGNEMSFNNIQSTLCTALREKLGITDSTTSYAWVTDVYSNFFIYEYDGKLWRLGYTAADTGVTISEDKPAQVQRVTEYRTVEGAKFVGNQDQTKTEEGMNKKQLVDAIILAAAAMAGSWSEADREALMALNDDQVKLIHNKVGKPKEAAPIPPVVPTVVPIANATTESPKIVSVKDYIAAAPREVQQVLNHSLEVYNEEKTKLVDSILAVKNNRFTKEDLGNRPIGELRALAALAGVQSGPAPSANYSGQGHIPTDNENAEEVLPAPVMNFGKETVAAK